MNKSEAPLISVVIPTYNYARLLPRAIESVLPQLSAESELLVIDDGSTDDTHQVLDSMSRRYPGTFRFLRKENGGAASARNLGLRASFGKFLVFLDADDELAASALGALAEHIATHPQSQVVLAPHWAVDTDGRRRLHVLPPIPDDPLERLKSYLLEKRIAISHGACAMHREVFSRGGYPEEFRNGEDIPVFAQAVANYSCSVLTAPMAIIYKHDDSLRHRLDYSLAGGGRLVDEVFSAKRQPLGFQVLKEAYRTQRNLSLFRGAYISGDKRTAKNLFREAVRQDFRVVFKWAYARKAIRLWVG